MRSSGRGGWRTTAAAILAVLGVPALGEGAGGLLALKVTDGRGGVTALGDLVGGAPAVVAAWGTYCAPCRTEVPGFVHAARRWPRVRFVALMTDVADGLEIDRLRQAWSVDADLRGVAAGQREALDMLLPAGLPATLFVRDGQVSRVDHFLSEESLHREIRDRLGLAGPAAVGFDGAGL